MDNIDYYEYSIVSSLQTFNMQETLNMLGKEYWEVVSMISTDGVNLTFLLKRIIKV